MTPLDKTALSCYTIRVGEGPHARFKGGAVHLFLHEFDRIACALSWVGLPGVADATLYL